MQSAIWWSNVVVLVIASGIDLRYRRIPNWLTAPFLLGGFIAQCVIGGFSGAGRSLAGIGVALLIFGAPSFFGAMGMGDFKLALGVAAWTGPGQFLTAAVLTGIAGGLLAICYAARRGTLGTSMDLASDIVRLRAAPRPPMGSGTAKSRSFPYAPAIAIGTLLSFYAR